MKIHRLFIVLTIANLGLLIFLLSEIRRVDAVAPASNPTSSVAPVLRGSALEIVDDQGRVRASIKLHPADPNFKMPDGKVGYPETVMFRLIDGKGRPEVKIGGSEQGGGLGLIGETDSTHVILEAQGATSLLKLSNKDGRQQQIKPSSER
ncbi:MAG: hypothetical protein DMF61_19145 [Blastocatellia bacterium AA13]|nr:MAG: hypothetical protein DMF61_19145 [Blastocatellia bacterium AA13]